jgi:hypothetical protein
MIRKAPREMPERIFHDVLFYNLKVIHDIHGVCP